MVLHLLKQQVVVAAAYRDLEHPIGVALDGTDTCAVQAKKAQHDTKVSETTGPIAQRRSLPAHLSSCAPGRGQTPESRAGWRRCCPAC